MTGHVDLGDLEPPLLLFGGPYSNLRAMEALIEQAGRRGIDADRMICTGDVVAYGAEAEETARAVRSLGCPVVMGNCEESLGLGLDDCGCGFEEGAACDALSARWFAHANARVSEASRAWMRALPRRLVFTMSGRRFAVLHGGAARINAFLWPTDPPEVFTDQRRLVEADLGPVDGIVAGHCGIPFAEDHEDMLWINPGAIGLPAHDGARCTWFAVLDAAGARFHRLDYDWRATGAAMRGAGLTEYAETIETGWWPSEDTLPPAMRRGATARRA